MGNIQESVNCSGMRQRGIINKHVLIATVPDILKLAILIDKQTPKYYLHALSVMQQFCNTQSCQFPQIQILLRFHSKAQNSPDCSCLITLQGYWEELEMSPVQCCSPVYLKGPVGKSAELFDQQELT